MSTSEAFVNPGLVRWARERRRLTPEVAANRIHAKFMAWEAGEQRPTLRQAQNMAKKLSVPFGYLFLSEPPTERIPLPDLRTVSGASPRPPSSEFIDLVNDVLRKQEWYRELQESEGAEPVPFIGKFSLNDTPETIAADITSTLRIDNTMRRNSSNWEEFLRYFIQRAERARVLVLRSGIVGSNTHRPLDVDEFRGFAISDDLAPLVFINGRDAKTAQIFTLAHELAHLWIGESGISNPDHMRLPSQQPNEIDRLSDQVAAETLIPHSSFELRWQDEDSVEDNLQKLATRFRVSRFVVLRRAYEHDKLTFQVYQDYYQDLVANLRRTGSQSGGDFYRTLLARNSSTFTANLLAAAAQGRVPDRDAARLLNVKVKKLEDIRNRVFLGSSANA